MHANLSERCRNAREVIEVPAFPLASIRAGVERTPVRPFPKRPLIATVVAGVSLVAIAAAAQVLQHTHVRFMPSGGIFISADAKSGSRPIHSDAEVREAAAHLDFPAILPAGLPEGSRPIRLYTSGRSLIAVTYDLPGAQRGPDHLLWIFIANPSTISDAKMPSSSPYIRGARMSQAHWREGAEEVIVVYKGLTASELDAIKRAMASGH